MRRWRRHASLDSHDSVTAVMEETSGDSLISELKTQVDVLTQQVVALTPVSIQPQAPWQFKVRCFTCGGMGHVCPSRNHRLSSSGNVRCFNYKCGQWGHMKKATGKCPRDACMGQQSSHTTLRPPVVVASVRVDVSTISGMWGGATVNMMMDSGSSISLVRRRLAQNQSVQGVQVLPVILIYV